MYTDQEMLEAQQKTVELYAVVNKISDTWMELADRVDRGKLALETAYRLFDDYMIQIAAVLLIGNIIIDQSNKAGRQMEDEIKSFVNKIEGK